MTKKRGNILFIDNDELLLGTWIIFLERAGYTVFKASTLQEAETLLDTRWIQLIICDVRMEDNDNPDDKSGIFFLEQIKYRAIPKIVVTTWPRTEDARHVMRSRQEYNGQKLVYDYLDKEEGPEEMLRVVDAAFQMHVNVNYGLEIKWQHLTLSTLLGTIDYDLPETQINSRVNEFEGLLRALFRNYAEVVIEQIITGTKRPPRLLAYARDGNRMQRYMVEIGRVAQIEEALNRYQQAIQINNASTWTHTTEMALREATPRYAAVAWNFRGFGTNLYLSTFHNRLIHLPPTDLINLINQICHDLIRPWHGPSHQSGLYDFLDGLGLSDPTAVCSQINQLIDHLNTRATSLGMGKFCIDPDTETMRFYPAQSDQTAILEMPTLTHVIEQLYANGQEQIESKFGIIHGNLRSNNLFFNSDNRAWVVGFDHCLIQAPLILEYIRFAQNLRLEWSSAVSAEEWYVLEKHLLTADNAIDSAANDWSETMLKYAHLLTHIKNNGIVQAAQTEENYWLTLFWVNIAKLCDQALCLDTCWELQSVMNLILSTGIIGDCLLDESADDPTTLTIGTENKEAIINNNKVALAPLEHDLLAFLLENPNRVVERKEIAEQVLDVGVAQLDDFDFKQTEYARVNMLVTRLRQKLQSAAGKTKFIKTVRGQGYRLELPES